MRICQICKQEIKIGQSWRDTGTGKVHIYCLIPKKITPAQFTKKPKRTGD